MKKSRMLCGLLGLCLIIVVFLAGCAEGKAYYNVEGKAYYSVVPTKIGASKIIRARPDISSLFCYGCLKKGANYFCSKDKSKCCKHIIEPGIYNISDCDIIHGYDNYFIKLNNIKTNPGNFNYFYFDIYTYKEGKGYILMNNAVIGGNPLNSGFGRILKSFNFNLQFVNYSNQILTLKKYSSCSETNNIFINNYDIIYPFPTDCVFEESPFFEKYFLKNTFIGVAPKGYPEIAQCAAKRVEVDMNKIYNLIGVNFPFPHVIAQYRQGSGGGASGNKIEASTDFTNQAQVQTMGTCDNPVGFHLHESSHLVMHPGYKINFSYCNMPIEGLAQFIETKLRFDQGDFDYMFDPSVFPQNCPKDLNRVVQCADKGLGTYQWNCSVTLHQPFTNLSLKDLSSCNSEYNFKLQYQEGTCFWYFIYTNYGPEKFKAVMQEIDQKRFIQDLNYPGPTYDLYNDILVPVLGTSIINFTKERWGIPIN